MARLRVNKRPTADRKKSIKAFDGHVSRRWDHVLNLLICPREEYASHGKEYVSQAKMKQCHCFKMNCLRARSLEISRLVWSNVGSD